MTAMFEAELHTRPVALERPVVVVLADALPVVWDGPHFAVVEALGLRPDAFDEQYVVM
jgi:hypothetical protein